MLTKEQIDHAWKLLLNVVGALEPYKEILRQAQQAIDLAAENERLKQDLAALTDVKRIADNLAEMERIKLKADNERLKAKLDAVRNQATEWIRATDGINQFTALYLNARAKDILAIIDKEDAT
jgi:chromosome condensin MukBEF ATPase and DNA-binding subunit MukB